MKDQAQAYVLGMQLVEAGTSIREAAKKAGVPFENLRVRVKGEVPVECRSGPTQVYLSDGANQGLLEVIEHRAARGFCVGRAELRFLIQQAAIVSSTRPVTPTFPGRSFVKRWVKRHSASITLRKARILEGCRAEASTEEAVKYYFDNLEAALDQLNLRDRPSQIWNCDETGVCAQGRCQQRVFAPNGMAANVQRSSDRENVTIMGCINAAGGHVPPMYIYAGQRRKVEWMEVAPKGAVCAMSESSNINGSLFMHWLKWFVGKLPAARPQLVILDGHFAHVNYEAVVWAKRHDVHLFALPAHTSHFLQPLDVGVYQPFKRLYEQELEQYPLREGVLPTRDDIGALTKIPFESAFSEKNAKRAFELAGIYPLCIAKMLGGLVGNKPPTDKASLRHHDVVVPHVEALDIGERQRRHLERQGLNIDALNVVNIACKKRAKLDKERAKMERSLAKEQAKVEKALRAMEKQRAKEERGQERASIKEHRAREKEEAKEQRALEMARRKVEKSLQSLRLKEGREREKQRHQSQKGMRRKANSHKAPLQQEIVVSVLV